MAHARRPRVPEESETLGLDRKEQLQLTHGAERAGTREHAQIRLLALSGLRLM
jgi:hypothetical protein